MVVHVHCSGACCREFSFQFSSEGPAAERSQVQMKTVEEWKKRLNKDLNMAVWLEFDVVDRHHVASIQCSI